MARRSVLGGEQIDQWHHQYGSLLPLDDHTPSSLAILVVRLGGIEPPALGLEVPISLRRHPRIAGNCQPIQAFKPGSVWAALGPVLTSPRTNPAHESGRRDEVLSSESETSAAATDIDKYEPDPSVVLRKNLG